MNSAEGADESDPRCHGDAVLYDCLVACGFDGPAYEEFEEELSKYGLSLITYWIRSRDIVTKIARRRLRGAQWLSSNAARHWPRDHEVDDLVNEILIRALELFRRKAMLGGEWNPNRGASLKTYFVGACLVVFLDVYRSWLRSQQRDAPIELFDLDQLAEIQEPSLASDPLHQIIAWEDVCEHLPEDELERRIVFYCSEDMTHAEIAEVIGGPATARSVEGALRRIRTRSSVRKREVGRDGRR